jgi:predicted small secreted protein
MTARKLFALLMLLGTIVTAVSGCRTAQGFGEDVEDAGEKIQEKVD